MSKSDNKAAVVAKANAGAAKKTDSKRRNFLIGAGLGGVGAAAALAGGVVGVKTETQAASEPVAEGKGYQETEHVRRYYGTTRI
ncbi:MAG: hypothetical protein KGL40_09855 [Rhodocyclaceae bacterium]|nr:hypothetical protein [Rhodocyclaceae bacterium]